MATDTEVKLVEDIIGYEFQAKGHLTQALTAAGAEEVNHDGNRKLAQLGTSLIEFLSIYIGFQANATRGKVAQRLIKMYGAADPSIGNTHHFKSRVSSIKQRATVAKRTGIDQCIKYDTRPGSHSLSVLGKAVNATVGATFVDSGSDITIACKVALRLGFVPATAMVLHNELINLAFSQDFDARKGRYQPQDAIA